MNHKAAQGFFFSVSAYALVHFITYFFEIAGLTTMLSILGVLILLSAFFLLPFKKIQLQLFLVVMALVVLLFTSNSVADDIVRGLQQMRSLIGLLLIVPMISWVLKEEPYIEEIMSFAHNFLNKSQKFYFGLMAMTQVISHFLLFGVVPMMYRFIDTFLKEHKDEAWENFKGTAILRGFGLSTLWVISIPSFIFAVEALEATLWKSIALGFVFALAGTILSVIFSYFQEKKYGVDFSHVLEQEVNKAMKNSRNQGNFNKDVAEFVFLFISLFGTIFFVHEITGVEFLLTIPLVILIWSLLYFLIKRKSSSFVVETRYYFSTGIAKQAQQFSILIAAGLLIYALNQSNVGDYVISGMNFLTGIIPLLNILFLIPFIVIFLGFIGLGPLPVIVLVTGVLEGISFPYPPELVVLAVTSGSVISIILSPFVMPVIILSSVNGLSGIRNGLQFNLKFAIAFYIMVQLFIQIAIHL
ncbi:hypothetical protein A1A1_06962 [Planococcus antarcticus DSM 14505]|uniref:Uncharacterized protein n=1 Tax=Planococcus antarcticus DSM 14505 TaxID=1185653 RepID=A0AA87LUG7_9BACL|nr:hypothetical protein [Planococcus antarcticus]EIM07317.1 hypothetical protein A1A1_06962 [Planococcus antarcticus DSM 14505]